MPRVVALLVLVFLATVAPGEARGQRYNPYADPREVVPPLAPDGTIQWGTFFKSAQLQLSYERLWSLGACRGTNKAITEPVENNKVLIDRLPEAEFAGVVHAAAGSLAGGVVAFTDKAAPAGDAAFFAQLHPAGVSRLAVTGTIAREQVVAGMVVRFRGRVDQRGRGAEPLRTLAVVTTAADFRPQPVQPDRIEEVIGTVASIHGNTLVVKVEAGRLRRLVLSLAEEAVVTVDGAYLDLVAPGDTVEVKGRLWSGAGSAGAGTIFASRVVVTKRPPQRPETRDVAAGAGQGAGPAVQ